MRDFSGIRWGINSDFPNEIQVYKNSKIVNRLPFTDFKIIKEIRLEKIVGELDDFHEKLGYSKIPKAKIKKIVFRKLDVHIPHNVGVVQSNPLRFCFEGESYKLLRQEKSNSSRQLLFPLNYCSKIEFSDFFLYDLGLPVFREAI